MDKLTADLVAQLLQMTQKPGQQRANSGPAAMDWFGEGPLADWSVATSQGGQQMGGDAGEWKWDPNDVQTYFSKSVGNDINDVYDSQGNFIEQQGPSESNKWGGLYPLAKLAATAGAMYAGASGLEGLLGGGGLGGGLGAGELTAEQLAAEGIFGGGGGAGGFVPFDAASFGLSGVAPLTADSLGMASLGSTLAPLDSGLSAPAAPGFLDKLGAKSSDFFSNPMNLLNTAGIVGSLYENSKDPDPVNQTQTTTSTATRNLDPSVSNALFGADRQGGLLGQMQGYFNKYPTGQNETMQQAQTGLRGLLGNPDVLSSLYKAGAAGQGLLTGGANAGAKPWWWRG